VDVISASGGYFDIVNHLSGLVMDTAGGARAHKLDRCAKKARITRPITQQGRLFRCTKEWRSVFCS